MSKTITKYGPMWQWECDLCHAMSDPWDTLKERDQEAKAHKCPNENLAKDIYEAIAPFLALPIGKVRASKVKAAIEAAL